MISLDRLLTLEKVPLYMIHEELGRHPIQINIQSRMIGVWLSIVNGKESKLSKLLYSMMLKEHEMGSYNFKWIRCINDILVAVGRPDLFKTEPVNIPNSVKKDISRTLSDLYIQEWNEKANVSSKGNQHFLFKDNLNFKKYLINVSKFYHSKIIKYRTGNHRLPVETRRWDNIPLNERKCKICTIDDIGNEYHYLFTCDFFKSNRKLYLKPYFYVKPNIRKYRELFTSTNEATRIKLSNFVAIIMEKFSV